MESQLGDFAILDAIGQGGMGTVYRAVQQRLNRPVALKILNPGTYQDANSLRRFQREMRLAVHLNHPCLVRVFDVGEAQGIHYIAMELVEGQSLEAFLHRYHPIPWRLGVAIVARVAEGLAYLHDQNILHRDMKLGNVLFSDAGAVKVCDFGLARSVNATRMTQDGHLVGTLTYMSPEIALGGDATQASDIWATGCVLYRLLTNQMPVRGNTADIVEWMKNLVTRPILPPTQVNPRIPYPVSTLTMQLLERDPELRTASAGAVASAVEELLAEENETVEALLSPSSLAQLLESRTEVQPEGSTTAAVAPDQVTAPVVAELDSESAPRPRRSRSFSVSAPAPPRTKPVALLASVGGALLLGLLVWFGQRGTPRPRPPVIASRPSPVATSRADAPAALTARWRAFQHYLPVLATGGPAARQAVLEMTRGCSLRLGASPDVWQTWLQLELWLQAGSGQPPRRKGAPSGPMGYFDWEVAFNFLKDVDHLDTSRLISAGLQAVLDGPDDGRGWLLLGEGYFRDGRYKAARILMDVALKRSRSLSLETFPQVFWTAYLHALREVPGRSPVTDFTYALELANGDLIGWNQLQLEGEENWRDRNAIFRAICQRPSLRRRGLMDYGNFLTNVMRDPVEAMRLWNEGLREGTPPAPEFAEILAEHLLTRGELASAAAMIARGGPGSPWQTFTLKMFREWHIRRPTPRGSIEARMLDVATRLTLAQALEARDALAAGDMVEAVRSRGAIRGDYLQGLFVEAVALGVKSQWLVDYCHDWLTNEDCFQLWNAACGACTSVVAARWLEETLRDCEKAYPRTGHWALVRGLWQSRRGFYAESLAQLDEARRKGGARLTFADRFGLEILARPLWMSALGEPVPQALLDRIREDPGLPPRDRYVATRLAATYWNALRRGDLAGAGRIALDGFAYEPFVTVWGATLLWVSQRSGNARMLKETAARLRAAYRYQGLDSWMVRQMLEL